MYKRFSELRFIIGLFFAIIAVILAVNMLLSETGNTLTIGTAMVFLVFGVAMMFIKTGNTKDQL